MTHDQWLTPRKFQIWNEISPTAVINNSLLVVSEALPLLLSLTIPPRNGFNMPRSRFCPLLHHSTPCWNHPLCSEIASRKPPRRKIDRMIWTRLSDNTNRVCQFILPRRVLIFLTIRFYRNAGCPPPEEKIKDEKWISNCLQQHMMPGNTWEGFLQIATHRSSEAHGVVMRAAPRD